MTALPTAVQDRERAVVQQAHQGVGDLLHPSLSFWGALGGQYCFPALPCRASTVGAPWGEFEC